MRWASMRRAEVPVAEAPLVRAQGLSIAWRGADGRETTVVDAVSFDLHGGEALGIAGESGSGKSTLARALLGWCRPGSRITAGRLEVGGIDLAAATPSALAALRGRVAAMVPQNPLSSLTFHRRAGRQVEEVLRTRSGLGAEAARVRALELMAATGLPDPPVLAGRYPHQLSGGQRQRVVVAAALSCAPKLLVLDEPTTALDKTTEAQVLDLVRALRTTHQAALVLVTHDLNVVAGVCDRVLVMQHGRVVETGPVRAVFTVPRMPYTRELLANALSLEGTPAAQPAPSAQKLLALSGLRFSHARPSLLRRAPAGKPTLDDISLDLAAGEVLGVIGESGSGKTTLGGLVAGAAAPDAGTIHFEGTPIALPASRRPAELQRRIQMIFQDPLSSLNPRRSVGDAIMRPIRRFFGLNAREARARAATLLADLGMAEEFLGRYPRQLSGGQQQRVAIARAFAAEPALLVCDEITSALDAAVQMQVLDELAAMQRRHATALLLITHDLAVIWRMAPRVVVMQGGRILEHGPTAEVFHAPRDRYTAGLLAAATRAARLAHAAPDAMHATIAD
jgi:ABC-type glutathione transport system ATPase component